jgi:hypothetical protein
VSSKGLFFVALLLASLILAKAIRNLLRKTDYVFSLWDGGYFRDGRVLDRKGTVVLAAQWLASRLRGLDLVGSVVSGLARRLSWHCGYRLRFDEGTEVQRR